MNQPGEAPPCAQCGCHRDANVHIHTNMFGYHKYVVNPVDILQQVAQGMFPGRTIDEPAFAKARAYCEEQVSYYKFENGQEVTVLKNHHDNYVGRKGKIKARRAGVDGSHPEYLVKLQGKSGPVSFEQTELE